MSKIIYPDISKFEMFNKLNNHEIDFHEFYDWIESLIQEAKTNYVST